MFSVLKSQKISVDVLEYWIENHQILVSVLIGCPDFVTSNAQTKLFFCISRITLKKTLTYQQ